MATEKGTATGRPAAAAGPETTGITEEKVAGAPDGTAGTAGPATPDAPPKAPTWQIRLKREIRNPRPASLIGFALAVMIAAALWTAGRSAEHPTGGQSPKTSLPTSAEEAH